MKTVQFHELDAENKLTAIAQILSLSNQYDYPHKDCWRDEEELKIDLEDGYDPDRHFTFYEDDKTEDIEVKIG